MPEPVSPQESETKTGTSPSRTSAHDARDRFLRQHLGLVHRLAQRIARSLPRAEYDELVSSGAVGLIRAADGFDASRGLAFSTFAIPHIRGAILDDLRRQDAVPRVVRDRSRQLFAARQKLTRALVGPPDDDLLAAYLGIDQRTLWRRQAEAERCFHVPLDESRPTGEGLSPLARTLTDPDARSIEDEIGTREDIARLAESIRSLTERERTVLALYYHEGMLLREIGATMDLTESRVSQIRTGALRTLRQRMGVAHAQAA
jgi:RNA polymerase sigma factor FliA